MVATATKKMQSTNYSEVNMVRWVEGQLAPMGGQTNYNFIFASKCKRVHGWLPITTLHICARRHVETGGQFIDITPTDMHASTPPEQGGYYSAKTRTDAARARRRRRDIEPLARLL